MIKRTLKWMVAGCTAILVCLTCIPAFVTAVRSIPEIDPELKANILKSTIQIRVYVPRPGSTSDVSNRHYDMGQGLGTIVTWQGQRMIVTHNHWGEMLKGAECVGFYDAQGNLLQVLGNADFNSLIRYRDPGTLVLLAPEALSIPAANLGDSQDVAIGEQVLVVHQDPKNPNQLDVLQGQIELDTHYRGEPVYQVSVFGNDRLIPGDSGGGIWHQGKLVGNNWEAISTTWLPGITTEAGRAAQLPEQYFTLYLASR